MNGHSLINGRKKNAKGSLSRKKIACFLILKSIICLKTIQPIDEGGSDRSQHGQYVHVSSRKLSIKDDKRSFQPVIWSLFAAYH